MFNKKIIFKVEGMKCEHCKEKVYNALIKLDNVKKVDINLKKKEVTIIIDKKYDIDILMIKDIINNLGYQCQE